MKNSVFFFEIEKIVESSNILEEIEKKYFFSYFQVDQKYYILVFAEKAFDPDLFYQFLTIIQNLDSKKRKIRSIRGFLIYALEIQNQGREYQILKTNLKPYFWPEVEKVIRQNKKSILLNFVFGNSSISSDTIENQVKSLQEKWISLESKIEKIKKIDPSEQLNFKSSSEISEKEILEIFEKAKSLSQDKNIPLKNFFEKTGSDTLFELKGYNLKYANLKRTKVYKNYFQKK